MLQFGFFPSKHHSGVLKFSAKLFAPESLNSLSIPLIQIFPPPGAPLIQIPPPPRACMMQVAGGRC